MDYLNSYHCGFSPGFRNESTLVALVYDLYQERDWGVWPCLSCLTSLQLLIIWYCTGLTLRIGTKGHCVRVVWLLYTGSVSKCCIGWLYPDHRGLSFPSASLTSSVNMWYHCSKSSIGCQDDTEPSVSYCCCWSVFVGWLINSKTAWDLAIWKNALIHMDWTGAWDPKMQPLRLHMNYRTLEAHTHPNHGNCNFLRAKL